MLGGLGGKGVHIVAPRNCEVCAWTLEWHRMVPGTQFRFCCFAFGSQGWVWGGGFAGLVPSGVQALRVWPLAFDSDRAPLRIRGAFVLSVLTARTWYHKGPRKCHGAGWDLCV